MRIQIDKEILNKYPTMSIGYVHAQVAVKPSDPFVENLKLTLINSLKEKEINPTNFVIHPQLAVWRSIYKNDFNINEKIYRSSVEALVRRIITGKSMWNICNVVDLYNCCSILSLLPMGGYDLAKVQGDITIRYANEGEKFRGIGEKAFVEVKGNHIVYADSHRLMCWLWNHKDAQETCIDASTNDVIFFIDSADSRTTSSLDYALNQLSKYLIKIGGSIKRFGKLTQESPQVEI